MKGGFFSQLKWSIIDQMKVMSINIRFENDQDEHPWSKRRHLIQDIVDEFQPFIFGTQEGRQAQLNNLASLVPSYQLIDQHRDWIDERMYPCLFVNKEHFDVKSSGDIWLSETPDVPGSKSFDSAFPRLCTWAKTQTKSGQNILFANVHLDHMKTETRQGQARVLCEELAKVSDDDTSIILMGDFNEGPDGEVRKIINSGFSQVQDGWLNLKQPEETSFHKFKGALPEGKRIDWILNSPELSIEKIQLDKRQVDNIYPTDHYPVLATYKL
jgi:endonuclease/exonuclease/phosphatase family metal-dependent hydrolase